MFPLPTTHPAVYLPTDNATALLHDRGEASHCSAYTSSSSSGGTQPRAPKERSKTGHPSWPDVGYVNTPRPPVSQHHPHAARTARSAVQVALPEPVVQVAAGGYMSFALAASGSLYAWGSNGNGEQGSGPWSWSGCRPNLVNALSDGRVKQVPSRSAAAAPQIPPPPFLNRTERMHVLFVCVRRRMTGRA